MIVNIAMMTSFLLAPLESSLDDLEQLETTNSKTTQIYLIRHGESTSNVVDENGVRLTSGRSLSIPLTEKGEQQAINLGEKLVEKLSPDEEYVLLSSTAVRAQETASRVFSSLSPYYSIERGDSYEGLCELGQGQWEGLPKDEVYEAAMQVWKDLSAQEKFTFPKIITGESYEEVSSRFLVDLQQIVNDHPGKTIFAVTHSAAANALALRLSGRIDELSDEPQTALPSIDLHNCDILQIELLQGELIEKAKVKMHISK